MLLEFFGGLDCAPGGRHRLLCPGGSFGCKFKLVFGVGLGLLGWLISFAIKALIFGAIIYLVIRILSPDTARRLREKFSGSSY